MVTLNVDIGEFADEPEELYRLATVVNVACGGHAGDEASMRRAATLAAASGAMVAAHPSYPDRAGFGRKTMAIAKEELRDAIAAQCEALARIAADVGRMHAPRSDAPHWNRAREQADPSRAREQADPGGPGSTPIATEDRAAAGVAVAARVAVAVRAVKLHGALYHDAARDPEIAEAVMEGASRGLGTRDLIWVGPGHGEVWQRARAAGLVYVREGFADRGTLPDGSLIPRGRPGALIEEPERAAEQAVVLARSGQVETICVHSDTRGAVAIARAVRAALDEAGLLAGAGKPS